MSVLDKIQTPLYWRNFFLKQKQKPYWKELETFLAREELKFKLYPEKKKIFSAFEYCPPHELKIVILGQDPYVNAYEATGLAFGVPENIRKVPPSLKNIFKEIKNEFKEEPHSTELTGWAQQGVLLLNTVLTVREGQRNSHAQKGWESFVDELLVEINQLKQPIVYLLWGSSAHLFAEKVTNSKHLVLKSAHPSPLSAYRGFFGCNHFLLANEYLKKMGQREIDWIHSGKRTPVFKQGELFL